MTLFSLNNTHTLIALPKKAKLLFCSLTLLTFIQPALVKANLWVEPNDLALRNNIQLLADSDIIKAPVTTYPLMWSAIISNIKSAEQSKLSTNQKQALTQVVIAYQAAQKHQNQVKLHSATTSDRFTSFGSSTYQQHQLSLSHQYHNDYFSGKLQLNHERSAHNISQENATDTQLDGSYVALHLGNWILTAGAIDRWWGPSLDTNLIMSTNARPLPAVAITRNNSSAFETPWLNWLGPWTFHAQMAKLEKERTIANAMMWSSRATIRPLRGLEMGVSWSFQWGGSGQPNDFSDFFNALAGNKECANGAETCDKELNTFLGNHIAGYDIRWSDTVFDLPYAIYGQHIGEDGSPGLGLITDKAWIYGAELRFNALNQSMMVNLEYGDTEVYCGEDENAFNCYYEHGQYATGYRFHQRTIGSTYDNDAHTLTTTVLGQFTNGDHWQVKLRLAKLNEDNLDRSPNNPLIGNTVSEVAEDLVELESQYNFNALNSNFTLGINLSHSKANSDTDTDSSAFIQWQYPQK